MKIAIDISPYVYGTGVSVYTKSLVQNLLMLDKENRYIFIGGSLRRPSSFKSILDIKTTVANNYELKTLPIPPTLADILWNRLHIIAIERLIGTVDIFHSSDWTQPPSKAFKVTTIHDLVPLKFPNLSHPRIVSAHKARLRWVLKEVDRVIVPSAVTASDVKKLGIKAKNIRIIPEAADPIFKPARKIEIAKLRRKYKISGKYLLVVGADPRKNIQRTIEAFHKIKKDLDLKLVVVGNQDILKSSADIIFVGHVVQKEMPIFYSGAEVLVYPSLYEGFGLPILESFACKTPVVTSNFGSMKEVAGKACVLVDPNKTDSISEGVIKAIKNKKSLINRGLARLGLYSWENIARQTLNVYEEGLY